MVTFLKSLFWGRARGDYSKTPLPPIEEMSFDQISAHIRNSSEELSLQIVISLVKRLYEIALYDHQVPMVDRENAYKLLEVLKSDVESSLAGNSEAIVAFKKGNSIMEDNARHTGVGSLAWIIEEHKIPPDEIVPFVMRPENEHLLADFLVTLDPATVENIKPQLVRSLILSRRYENITNAVLVLHGLAAKADPAAGAIFTAEERVALLSVPDDYGAGRNVLVNLGLLPSDSSACPLKPTLDIELLRSFIASLQTERDTATHADPRLDGVSEDRRMVILLALTSLRSHLIRRVIHQLYGGEFSEALLNIHSLDLVKQTLKRFDEIAAKLTLITPPTSIDFMLFAKIMEMSDLAFENEEAYEREKDWMQMCGDWLNQERVELLDHLRFVLRWVSDASPPEVRSVVDKDICNFLREIYMRKGAQAGIAEKAMYFEDWIGTDA